MSGFFAIVSPLVALALTVIFGELMFALLGKDPFDALFSFFIEPLLEVWSLHELAIKAAPLILIAVGLSVAYRSNNWNIGAEGQFTVGAITGSFLPVVFYEWHSPLLLPLMLILGMVGGALYAAIPALLKARFNTNEILTSLMLVYIAQLFLDWLVRGLWRDPAGYNFPQSRSFVTEGVLPEMLSSGRAHWGFAFAIIAAIGVLVHDALYAQRLPGRGARPVGAGRAVRRLLLAGHDLVLHAVFRRACRACRHIRSFRGSIGHLQPSISPGYGYCDHRRFPRPSQPARHHRLGPGAGVDLSRRGGAQLSIGVSDKVTRVFQGLLLFFVLSCDTLIHYRIRLVLGKGRAVIARAGR